MGPPLEYRLSGSRRGLMSGVGSTAKEGIAEMISKKLVEDMKIAMKSGDKERLSVIRMLLAELKNASLAAAREMTQEEEERVVATYAKKRQEAMDAYKQAGRMDLFAKEEREYATTVAYLPPRLSDEELSAIIAEKIAETGAQGMKEFGKLMKAVMASVGSRADGSAVSAAVKKVISEKG